jgi:hypothetical protein
LHFSSGGWDFSPSVILKLLYFVEIFPGHHTSCDIVSVKDRVLPVAMEEAPAKRMGAAITTLPTGHMVILEAPAKVAGVIDEAARNTLARNRSREATSGR